MFRINSVYKLQGKDYFVLLKMIPSHIIWIDTSIIRVLTPL